MSVTKNNCVRCDICGKFISHQDFIDGKTSGSYTPETIYGHEKIEHFCANCTNDMTKCKTA